jgi:hypothetical protein
VDASALVSVAVVGREPRVAADVVVKDVEALFPILSEESSALRRGNNGAARIASCLIATLEDILAKTLRGLTAERVRELAREGAEKLLRQLRAEIVAVERTFPELALPQRRRQVRQAVQRARKQSRTMSAAARKAVSQRMKKYWEERKKAKAKVR